MDTDPLVISDDALKILVAEHGVRGTARLLGMDDRQRDAFRQRVTRGKWLSDPAMAKIRERTVVGPNASVAKPVVATVSPNAAIAAEIATLGSKSRVSIARGVAKAAETVENMAGDAILAISSDVKNIAQTADLALGWKDAAPQVKIRLDVLGAAQEQPLIDVQAEVTPVDSWDYEAELDEY